MNQDSTLTIAPDLKRRVEQLSDRLSVSSHKIIDNVVRNGLATLERASSQ